MTISEGQKKAIAGGSALAIPPILYGIIDLVYFPTLTKLKANPGISEFTANRIAVGSAIDA